MYVEHMYLNFKILVLIFFITIDSLTTQYYFIYSQFYAFYAQVFCGSFLIYQNMMILLLLKSFYVLNLCRTNLKVHEFMSKSCVSCRQRQ